MDLFIREHNGSTVVSNTPELPNLTKQIIDVWQESLIQRRREERHTVKILPCDCKDEKFRNVPHIQILICQGREAKLCPEPVFTLARAEIVLKHLEQKGYLTSRQATIALNKVRKHIRITQLNNSHKPDLEEQLISAHKAQDFHQIFKF